jgi:hypothetical protein
VCEEERRVEDETVKGAVFVENEESPSLSLIVRSAEDNKGPSLGLMRLAEKEMERGL